MHIPSLALYVASSMVLMVINPILFGRYAWPSAMLLTAIQNIGMIALCLRQESFTSLIEGFRSSQLLAIAHIGLINVVFGVLGSSLMSLAMFTAIRRVSIAFTMYGNALVGNADWPSREIQLCVWVMIIAAGGAALRDSVFDVLLYMYVMVNNFCTAVVQVGTKSALAGVSKWRILFVTAIVSWLWTLVFMMTGDVGQVRWSVPMVVTLIISCLGGIAINVGATWVIEKDGPLFLAMAGAAKNIVIALLSVLGLAGAKYEYDFWNVCGLLVAAGASVVYVYLKHRPQQSIPEVCNKV